MRALLYLLTVLASQVSMADLLTPKPNQAQASESLRAFVDSIGADNLLINSEALNTPKPNDPMVLLGRALFFTKSLSGNFDVACASCHHPLLAGGDKLSLGVGEAAYEPNLLGPGRWHDWQASADPEADGTPNVPRNSSTTFNTALYNRALFQDGRVSVIDDETKRQGVDQNHRTPDSTFNLPDPRAGKNLTASQARFPIVSPEEMRGYPFDETESNEQVRDRLAARLRGETGEIEADYWIQQFQRNLQNDEDGLASINYENIQDALSAYQVSQIMIDNPWYRFVKGDDAALNEQQQKGALLFFKLPSQGGAGCGACHQPPFFTDEQFHNIAMPQFGRGKAVDDSDDGHRLVTQQEIDRFAFRTPNLLNVNATGPYGHTGAYLNLHDTIEHHLDPALSIAKFDYTFSNNPQLKPLAKHLGQTQSLTKQALTKLQLDQSNENSLLPTDLTLETADIDALVSFLEALTDPCINDPKCLDPWLPGKQEQKDPHLLIATFSKFDAPPPIAPTKPSFYFPEAIKPTASNSQLRFSNTCANNVTKKNRGGFTFTEVTEFAGLNQSHAIDSQLFDMDTFQPFLFSGGAASGDFDGDCWNDLFVISGGATNRMYRNSGNGDFIDVSKLWGIEGEEISNGATFADIDGDDDLDLIVTNVQFPRGSIMSQQFGKDLHNAPSIYRNIQQKRMQLWPELGVASLNQSWSAAFGDYDVDGDLDLITTHWGAKTTGRPHFLWRNDSTSTNTTTGIGTSNNVKAQDEHHYTSTERQAGLLDITGKVNFSFTSNFSDMNLDGYPDLLIAADFETSQVYLNNRNNTFTNITTKNSINDENGMGAAIIDYDNDGDLDWFITSIFDADGIAEGFWGVSGNRLYNNVDGQFEDVTEHAGVREGYWAWGACFADFNNDSWPDIYYANGPGEFDEEILSVIQRKVDPEIKEMVTRRLVIDIEDLKLSPNRLYISNRDGTFTETASTWGVDSEKHGRAVICSDYDRDGDVDIFVTNNRDKPHLFNNNVRSEKNTNFINIRLKGVDKNTEAIGAKVYVTANGVTQMQEMHAGGSYLSGAPAEMHFGLGAATQVDEIKVVWPRPNYVEQNLTNATVNQFITIHQ